MRGGSIQHTPVGHCDKFNIYAQHMVGYIFTWICIGMLLKPYMKILKLYYMVLHFCRFLDGNCIFISVPYIYSHLFWICNLRNILFWIECNLRWNFPFQFTQFVTGDWSVPTSAANRLIGEVVQSRKRPLLGPSPGWKRLLALSHLRHY